MSLAQAIRVRHLFGRLDQAEANTFITTLWRDHREIIISSLFSHIRQPSNDTAAQAVNQSIAAIIEARKSNDDAKSESETQQPISLAQLPHALIGETASFLPQTDFAHLSRGSRFLFISCHSPNVLRELDLRNKRNIDLNLAQFVSVRSLLATVDNLNEWTSRQRALSRLQSVTLLSGTSQEFGDFNEFVDCPHLGLDNVSTLNCRFTAPFETVIFEWILEAFPNIQSLRLFGIRFAIEDEDDPEFEIPALALSKLTCLELLCSHFQHHLNTAVLYAVSHQLLHLRLCMGTMGGPMQWDAQRISFGHLEELIIIRATKQIILDISETGSNLKTVMLDIDFRTTNNIDGIGDVLSALFIRCPLLSSLTLYFTKDNVNTVSLEHVLGALECASRNLKSAKGQEELCVQISLNKVTVGSKLRSSIRQTAQALEASGIERIVVFIAFKGCDVDMAEHCFEEMKVDALSVALAPQGLIFQKGLAGVDDVIDSVEQSWMMDPDFWIKLLRAGAQD